MSTDLEESTSNRARGRQLLIGAGVVVALTLGAVAGWQWYAGRGAGTEVDSGKRIVPAASADFADVEVVWAQRDQLHLDDTTIAPGPGRAQELTWTPYGVFVWMRADDPRSSRLVYATTQEVAEVSGRPGDIVVSADGRYAAWVDRDGPRVPMGPRAVVVVVDLERGTELLRSGAGMGEIGDDFADLYSELDPQALGFEGSGDQLVVVYRNAEGSGEVVGVRVATGASVGVPAGPVGTHRDGMLGSDDLPDWTFDARTGSPVGVDRGRLSGGGYTAQLSPDRSLLVRTGLGSRLRVFTVPGGADVTPELPAGSTRFGGFLPDGDVLVLHERRRTPTTLLRCAVEAQRCDEVARATGRGRVVVPAG